MPAILLFAALGGLYALMYFLNQSTPYPEGCEDIQAVCSGCTSGTCSVRPIQTQKEGL